MLAHSSEEIVGLEAEWLNMDYIIVHHTGGTDKNPLEDTSHHTFEIVNEYHKKKWDFRSSLGFYIGYHYFIGKDGKVTQGRADNEEGAHTKGQNHHIGICLAGNFDATDPTQEQIIAARDLLERKTVEYNIPEENIVPHRAFAKKTCYGSRLSDDWGKELIFNSKPMRVKIIVADKESETLQQKVDSVRNWFEEKSEGKFTIDYDIEHVKPSDIQWDNKKEFITRDWRRLNIAPHASGYDIVVYFVEIGRWKSRMYGFSSVKKMLGTQIICIELDESRIDSRNRGFNGNNGLSATLRHELMHSFYQLQDSSHNYKNEHKEGDDNTHYFDYVEKSLEKSFKELSLEKMVGWIPNRGERMFVYLPFAMNKQKEFSGNLREGTLYRTADYRMFFRYTPEGWKILSRSEFLSKKNDDENHTIMSNQEGNWIYAQLKTALPATRVRDIREVIAYSEEEKESYLKQGYSLFIPNRHI